MYKVKIFDNIVPGHGPVAEKATLEGPINKWLCQNPNIQIAAVTQAVQDRYLQIVVFYKEETK